MGQLQLFVTLFNNIAVPCFVFAVISPSCFYHVFVAAPPVTSCYLYVECAESGDYYCLSQ